MFYHALAHFTQETTRQSRVESLGQGIGILKVFSHTADCTTLQSRLTEKVDFWSVHYNRPVYQFVCPKSAKSVYLLSVSETGHNS